MVKRLSQQGINCTYTLLQSISFLIDKVTKVFVGASSVLYNGSIIAKSGTAMLTAIAKRHQKPVVVFSETYKFTDRVNLDPININEIGDPESIIMNPQVQQSKAKGVIKSQEYLSKNNFNLVNLKYDLTPSENINMVRYHSCLISS